VSGRSVLLPVLVLACLVAALTAGSALKVGADRPSAQWRDSTPSASLAEGEPSPTPAPTGPPVRLRIRAIGVDAPMERLHRDGAGALDAPDDYARAGWYAEGTPPGDTGPAVIAGHVDSRSGPAVFYRLHELRTGDVIEVARGGRWLAFRVVGSGWYAKAAFPTAEVYGPTPTAQLRLVTCGGEFDRSRRSYTDNLVVFAVAQLS
jgi:Sortase domain